MAFGNNTACLIKPYPRACGWEQWQGFQGLAKCILREDPCDQHWHPSFWTMQCWWSNSKRCLFPPSTEAWAFFSMYLPPHQEPSNRKSCSLCFVHTTWIWPVLCFPIFFHEHLSVINRKCSIQPRSLGQERHVSPGFSYSAGMCSSCLAGLWGPIESSLGLVSKWSKLWRLFSRQSWLEGWEG